MNLASSENPVLAPSQTVRLDPDHRLSVFELYAIGQGQVLALSAHAHQAIQAGFAKLQACMDAQSVVYGVTTGFGPLANRLISNQDAQRLQTGLVYHLASGVGAKFEAPLARMILAARLRAMIAGWSGASPDLVSCITDFLNAGLAPAIPERGTVGASGDLTPLAHCALALTGRGEVIAPNGVTRPAMQALAEHELTPLALDNRDGLALVNGVAAMTGVAAHNAVLAERLAHWTLSICAMQAELLQGLAESWDPAFALARPHPGVGHVIEQLQARIQGASRLKPRLAEQSLDEDAHRVLDHVPQDPYSLRCVPQLVGAFWDAMTHHHQIVETELNSVSDNPLFTDAAPYALHGGNFFGQHVAMAADHLSTAIIQLANLHERQIARLTDEKKNRGFPAFLSGGVIGLDSGFMGAQVTASAITAEMRAFVPLSFQGLSTNGDNQDVVTMGTSAARRTKTLLEDLSLVMAINLHACAQAFDLSVQQGANPEAYSPATRTLYEAIRAQVDFVGQDRPLGPELEQLAQWVCARDCPFKDDADD